MATIVNAGLTEVAKLIVGADSPVAFTYIALGSGTTAEANDQTALVTEITTNGGERASATASYEADYKGKLVKTFSFTGPLSVNEVGVFNDASAGDMLLRHKFASTKAVENGDTLEVTVKTTVARSA
ncbi:MAG: hypothetical protein BWY21_00304 [Parcubacteria group bacterium ADurb.Bin216]|nr:MAG: hypothetical protein BWY21_00304 [Parcubacteria group bacterium ADurb.Bin216]